MTNGDLNNLTKGRFAIVTSNVRDSINQYLFFKNWIGDINVRGNVTNTHNDVVVTPSGMPIERNFDQLTSPGMGNTLVIPTRGQYAGVPKFGDALAKGFEEDFGYTWTNLFYNQIRHPVVVQNGEQDMLQEEILRGAENAAPLLGDFFSKWKNWNIAIALYERYSENLSAAAGDGGLGLTKAYHPNFYYINGTNYLTGALTKVTATVGLFTTAAALTVAAGLTFNTQTSRLNTAALRAMAAKARELNIEKAVTIDGKSYWYLIIHSLHAAQLLADNDFRDTQRYMLMGQGMNQNSYVTGSMGIYAEFIIFIDDIICRGWNITDSNFLGHNRIDNGNTDLATKNVKYNRRWNTYYHESDTGTGQDDYSNRCAIVIGKSALGLAQKRLFEFRYDDDDYQNIKGLLGKENYGVTRLDRVSQDELQYLASTPSSCTTVVNDSSMIVMIGY